MRIEGITLHAIPIHVGMDLTRYVASQKIDPKLETLVVRIDTDTGLIGWGEVCSAPPYYLPELAAGAREGIMHVAPVVLGRDPRQVRAIIADVASALRGHGNAKTALEMALWDLAAKAHHLPLVELWGGPVADSMPVLAVVRIGTQEETAASFDEYRAMGYSRFQIKIASATPQDDIRTIRMVMEMAEPHERVWFDPNRAWLVDDAVRVISAVRDLAPMIENPCESYQECRNVARRTGVPFMLDEVIDGPRRFLEAVRDEVMDVASLKMSAVGGLEQTRVIMCLGTELGVPMRIEDYYGTGILLAAVTHLAHTLPRRLAFGLYDYVSTELPLVRNPLKVERGEIRIPDTPGPGLGVEIDEDLLGRPVAELF